MILILHRTLKNSANGIRKTIRIDLLKMAIKKQYLGFFPLCEHEKRDFELFMKHCKLISKGEISSKWDEELKKIRKNKSVKLIILDDYRDFK